MERKPMIGVRFGKLKVLEIDHTDQKGYHYLCECDCGNKVVARGCNLRNGHTKSCGCYRRYSQNTNLYHARG